MNRTRYADFHVTVCHKRAKRNNYQKHATLWPFSAKPRIMRAWAVSGTREKTNWGDISRQHVTRAKDIIFMGYPGRKTYFQFVEYNRKTRDLISLKDKPPQTDRQCRTVQGLLEDQPLSSSEKKLAYVRFMQPVSSTHSSKRSSQTSVDHCLHLP